MRQDTERERDAQTQERVIAFVAQAALRLLRAQRVLLFGSRAHGSNSTRSDYDFAIEASPGFENQWSLFACEVDEAAPTLNGIDLVDLNAALSDGLRSEIALTGIDVTASAENSGGVTGAGKKD